MKKTNPILLMIFSLLVSNFFYSCNTRKIGYFHNSSPSYSVKEKENTNSATAYASTVTIKEGTSEFCAAETNSSQGASDFSHNGPFAPSVNDVRDIEPAKNLTKQEKKEIKKFIKENLKQGNQNATEINTLLLVIIAILLPPVAVALVDGFSGPFWLSILLTLLFYIPGLIYALYRIFRQK